RRNGAGALRFAPARPHESSRGEKRKSGNLGEGGVSLGHRAGHAGSTSQHSSLGGTLCVRSFLESQPQLDPLLLPIGDVAVDEELASLPGPPRRERRATIALLAVTAL